jgi:hypothetical protein
MTLGLGAGVMIGEFFFITVGTYFYYCWDVMEPIAYLMLMGNLTVAFGYFGLKGRELDQDTLQRSWFTTVAKKLYRAMGFDYDGYLQIQKDVQDLRILIKDSV